MVDLETVAFTLSVLSVALAALFVVSLPGSPPQVAFQSWGLWLACSCAACGAVSWVSGWYPVAVVDTFGVVLWAWLWWSSRPPRPPRRMRVARPVRQGASRWMI